MLEQDAGLIAREREWVKSFVKFGAPFLSACAAVGNVAWENKAHTVTTGALDHESQGGFQWRKDRLDSTSASPRRIPGPYGLKDWCAAHGLDWQTVDAQVQFFLWELKEFYPELSAEFFNPATLTARGVPDDLATMTANIMDVYEVPAPATAHLQDRIDAARYCFDNFKDLAESQPGLTPMPTPKPTPAPQPKPKPVPTPAPESSSTPELERLIVIWRSAKAATVAATANEAEAHKAIDDEIAKIEVDLLSKKKELGI